MTDIGIKQVAERIHSRLQRYLEAQYHIKDRALIEERHLLLLEPGAIAQRPFVEVTPSYAVETGFNALKIPQSVSNLLTELGGFRPSIGVYPPYKHQADALEAFFGNVADDLIVATGTGSGKTETFLYSAIGSLVMEATERQASFALPGARVLLLYPMNALVSDQTSRLRRLFGDERMAGLFEKRWGRRPRFGMYTSRTPYPEIRTNAKDGRNIAPLLEYFVELEQSQDEDKQNLVNELKSRGRWPAKDLIGFLAPDEEEIKTYKSGKKAGGTYRSKHWDHRLITQPGDRELLTRHEIQKSPPDLLVTNYSMLEYMLLRPIERSIFRQTSEWLASDSRNQFLLVLDEAHMYRGVSGAEVGLLIRRLQSRLGISRDRMRCILTSASLGSGPTAEEAGKAFGEALTGKRQKGSFTVIRGTRETRPKSSPGTTEEAAAFAAVNPTVFAGIDEAAIEQSLGSVAASLGWAPPDGERRQYVDMQLLGTGPLELLIEVCAGNGTAFESLAHQLFPTVPQKQAEAATDGLLALGAYARRHEAGRQEQPLLPTRVHMFFRGLPSVHACLNEACTERRITEEARSILGRFYTEPRTHCKCGARVFEIFTHRDCGTSFIRAFGVGRRADFLWNEQGGTLSQFGAPLHEIHFLLEEPHPDHVRDVEPVWLDIATGRLQDRQPSKAAGFRLLYRPTEADGKEGLSTFSVCPICTRRTNTGGSLKIMDLATKGEQPFANLIREQFVNQVATKPLDERHPNEGRKALLFSDGRQKAARLARDLPREVERDSLREALIAALKELSDIGKEPVADDTLYAAFVRVCALHHLHFFDGHDQRALLEDCQRLQKDYDLELSVALDDGWKPTPPTRFRQALLRQISDPYYSLIAACAVVVQPRRTKLKLLERRVPAVAFETLSEITEAWIGEMLYHDAFDPSLPLTARYQEFPFFEPLRADDGLKTFFADVAKRAQLDAAITDQLRRELFDVFTRTAVSADDSGRLLTGDTLSIKTAIDDIWWQCLFCGDVQSAAFLGSCAKCGQKELEARPPDHPYMRARKDFFREPLRAVLKGQRPVHITAEEHTAQLSQRDAGVVYATTEEFELRFQDVPLGKDKPAVDVLSCTTTMEVGIDIGSLTAVGLRTVPPLRENYQQRAGRAGRRGTSVSSVLTFAQGGAHDAYHFEHPEVMISGPAREPRIKSDNQRLARRHIHSYLLQTFFHQQMDQLPETQQESLAAARPDLMSAFGSATAFFKGDDEFTFAAFEKWMKGVNSKSVRERIVSWLPDELFPDKSSRDADKMAFVKETSAHLLEELAKVGKELEPKKAEAEKEGEAGISAEEEETAEPTTLLDLLFDKGLLPSYAFPTDLCSFVIQEREKYGKIIERERPQLAKTQALSEYAPGRILVVNKQTYRVGGIFFEGLATASPAEGFFDGVRERYIGCPRCSFVRLDQAADAKSPLPNADCPVCGGELQVNELLDPPAFSPEAGRRLKDEDRDQDITYASSAEMPELLDRDFDWDTLTGAEMSFAYREGVKLIVTNKGKSGAGFGVCETCGGAWLSDDPDSEKEHPRPFLLPDYVIKREQPPKKCNGHVRKGLYLGHQFRTDILLLRLEFNTMMDFSPDCPWLNDALATCAEAVALGSSLGLSIDPGELSSGYRFVSSSHGGIGAAEVYLFDTASGGAGYAYEVGRNLPEMLQHIEALLTTCPGHCERSCTKCLRHYGNRFLHPRLDRRLGLQLLRYARSSEQPSIPSASEQRNTLEPLSRFLTLEGWSVEWADSALVATAKNGAKPLAIGTYPALLSKVEARKRHPLSQQSKVISILLPDYLVDRDLPSAYQEIMKHIKV
jgi:ATP-dependent helicase YprA (DUF1998 family)